MRTKNSGAIIEDNIRVDLLKDIFKRMGTVETLIDVGCGVRSYMNLYAPYSKKTIGADLADSPFEKQQVDIYCSATTIPLPDSSVDTYFSSEVLHDIREPHEMFCEAYRILKPGGTLITTSPFVTPLCDGIYDHYRFTKHGLKYLMEKNGFTDVEIFENGDIIDVTIQTAIKPHLRFWNIISKKTGIRLFSFLFNPFIFLFIFLPQVLYLCLYHLSKHIGLLKKIYKSLNYGSLCYVSIAIKNHKTN